MISRMKTVVKTDLDLKVNEQKMRKAWNGKVPRLFKCIEMAVRRGCISGKTDFACGWESAVYLQSTLLGVDGKECHWYNK